LEAAQLQFTRLLLTNQLRKKRQTPPQNLPTKKQNLIRLVLRKNAHPTLFTKWKRTGLWLGEGMCIENTARVVMGWMAMDKEKWPKT
jgi:hypothetical protein